MIPVTTASPAESHISTLCDGRTHRACTETMTIRALLDGHYEIHSQSGRTYRVDPTNWTCTCPDSHHGCKHVRRVKLDIACGELPHPDDCPTDDNLAAREPPRAPSTPTQTPPPATAVADGGQTIETMPESETGTASVAICRAISDRIRDLEREIDCYQAELHDLQTALAVIEDVTEQPHLPTLAPPVPTHPPVNAATESTD